MKKVLFAVALVMGLGSSVAFAGNMVSDVEIVVMVNDYKPIEVKDLPQAVQDTIKKDFADLTIKEAAVEESAPAALRPTCRRSSFIRLSSLLWSSTN